MLSAVDERPSRSERPLARAIVGTVLVLFGALSLLPWTTATPRLVILGVFAGAVVLSFLLRASAAAHGALVGLAFLAPLVTPGLGYMWPLTSVVTLVAYAAVVRTVPTLRASARFVARGRLDRTSALLVASFVVMAAIALVIWRYLSGADMTVYRAFIPAGIPRSLIFVAIVPYAMLNAIFEETIWRGALWQACESSFGRAAALALTSLSFGVAHYHGFPSGFIGMGLAGIYGLMMGIVRWRTDGILWPWLAHVVADVVIFTMVAAMVV